LDDIEGKIGNEGRETTRLRMKWNEMRWPVSVFPAQAERVNCIKPVPQLGEDKVNPRRCLSEIGELSIDAE
jgi:hypothetical protein